MSTCCCSVCVCVQVPRKLIALPLLPINRDSESGSEKAARAAHQMSIQCNNFVACVMKLFDRLRLRTQNSNRLDSTGLLGSSCFLMSALDIDVAYLP